MLYTLALGLALTVRASAQSNILCDSSAWNIIKGQWSFDESDCSIQNTDSGAGNIVWFGSADGLTPDDSYDDEEFELTVVMEQVSGGDAGILFRTGESSTKNDEGPSYYIGLYPGSNRVVFGTLNDGWSAKHSASVGMSWNTEYTLKVIGHGNSYTVYLNGQEILSGITRTEFSSGSIGLRSYHSPCTYHSMTYKRYGTTASPTADPTEVPTEMPSTAPTHEPTQDPVRDCSALHIDEYLQDCSSEFDGHSVDIAILQGNVSTLDGAIDTLDATISSHAAAFLALEESVDELMNTTATADAAIVQINAELQSIMEQLDKLGDYPASASSVGVGNLGWFEQTAGGSTTVWSAKDLTIGVLVLVNLVTIAILAVVCFKGSAGKVQYGAVTFASDSELANMK